MLTSISSVGWQHCSGKKNANPGLSPSGGCLGKPICLLSRLGLRENGNGFGTQQSWSPYSKALFHSFVVGKYPLQGSISMGCP